MIENELGRKEPMLTITGDDGTVSGYRLITNDSSGNPVVVRSASPGDNVSIVPSGNTLTWSVPGLTTVITDVGNLQSDVSQLQGQVNNLAEEVITVEGNIATLQTETTAIQGEISTINNQLITYQNTFNATEAFTIQLSNQDKWSIEMTGGGLITHNINWAGGTYYLAGLSPLS